MLRFLFAAFLIAHGLVHVFLFRLSPSVDEAPFVASDSWALRFAHVGSQPMKLYATELSGGIATFLTIAGVFLIFHWSAWAVFAGIGAVGGLALKVLYFHKWLVVGMLIDIAILWLLVMQLPASLH